MCYVMSRMLLGVVISAIPLVGAAVAQEQQDDVIMRVVTLERLEPVEAAEIISDVYTHSMHSVTPVEGTDRLVMRGFASDVNEAISLLQQIDADPRVGGDVELRTEFVQVDTYPIGELAPLLSVVEGTNLNIGLDSVNRRLILRGLDDQIKIVKKLVKEIDQPLQSLSMNFFFIRGELGEPFDPDAGGLPVSLIAVGETLAENGVGEAGLMGTLMVRANLGEHFDTEWSQEQPDTGDESLRFAVEGKAEMHRGSDTVQLKVGTRMHGSAGGSSGERGTRRSSQFELDTTLSLPLDRYVILAAAPSTTQSGSGVALVVRATKD